MQNFRRYAINFFFLMCVGFSLNAQTLSASSAGLFENDSILSITLSGDLRSLLNDRGNNPQSHPLILSYKADNGGEVSISIHAKTRGHFRRTMGDCKYPPLLLEFTKSDTLAASVFHQQRKIKLVVPCRDEEYVLREWMVYKIYNLVTPESFRVRLVRITLNDTKRKKIADSFYGFLLEDEQQLAARNHDIIIKKQTDPLQIEPDNFMKMAVFEYMIGNTDWSVQFQNIKVLAQDSVAVPVAVPYDFDFSGVVNAPYAKPADELKMNSVRERRYRGYCLQDIKSFDGVIAFYNNLKPAIYKLYSTCSLLPAKYIKETLTYFDQFYKTINDPVAAKKEFTYPCDKNGTGNVIIQGLKGNVAPVDSDE